MTQHDALVRLKHMRDYAQAALRLRDRGSRELLDDDEMYSFSLIHAVSMIGQSASEVPGEVQEKSPQIPWSDIIGMRRRHIHGYDFIRYDIVWDTVQTDVPDLIEKLNVLVQRLSS